MTDSPAINKFLDDLITQKHGTEIPPEAREQIKSELSPRLHKWFILKAMDLFVTKSPKTLRAFQDLAEGDTHPTLILKFIQENISDTTVFFTTAMVEFWKAYLGEKTAV